MPPTINLNQEDESADQKEPAGEVQMGTNSKAKPDIRPNADARGRVQKPSAAATPVPDHRSLFERFFGPRHQPAGPTPAPRTAPGVPLVPFRH